MSTLFLVRHGQARFLTDDYDRLSDLGRVQSGRVGRYFCDESVTVDQVWTGTLVRQRDTAVEARAASAEAGREWPAALTLEGLDEYPADAIKATIAPQLADRDPSFAALLADMREATERRARYRLVHLVLEAVMDAWIAGHYEGPDLLSWPEFSARVKGALKEIMSAAPRSSTSVVVTSGGPIGVAVQSVLQAPDREAARLNWRVYNASMTRFTFSGARISLDQFNAIPHLRDPAERTYR